MFWPYPPPPGDLYAISVVGKKTLGNIQVMSIYTATSDCQSVTSHSRIIYSIFGGMVLAVNIVMIDNFALKVSASGETIATIVNGSGARCSG
jgi:hypothetical protein